MKWSSNNELLIPIFFFWNLGTALQNSHVGLTRSLLHAVLEAHEELIPIVFPVLWHNWKPSDEDIEPPYIEAKKAFELLLGRSSSFLRLCIFVDGIDEYNGDHKDMSLFLRSLTTSTHVKVVVSSRPITACVNAFQHCPTLRLQDLTKGDMEIYVRENLCRHQSMFATRNGLLRYLKLLAHNDRLPSALSNILILHALESWQDHRMKPYLNQRIDTLQFVLQNAAGLRNGSYWRSIWEYGMIVADDLQNRGMPLDCAELLKVLLLAGRSRAPLGTSKVHKPGKPQETIDPLELVRQLKNYQSPRDKDVTPLSYTALQAIKLHDEQVKQLGSELELLALAYDASYETI
jgi:hypothetical protein